MALKINGDVDILTARVTEERVGGWNAVVEADSDDDITGEVELDVEGETFAGVVEQGAVDAGRWKGLVIGGKGGIQKLLGAKYYYTPTVKTVLDDLASDSGETLAAEIDPSLYLKRFERFCRLEGAAHTQFRQLADELGIDWRITRAGELWFGAETWLPATTKTIAAEYDPQLRVMQVAYDSDDDRPVLRPGVTYVVDGEPKKIQRVVTEANAGGLRQLLFFDAEKGDAGLWATVRRVIRETVWPKLQLARVHGARVTEQAADGTLSVALDDPAIGGKFKGLNHVEPVFGLPGVTMTATSATRLRFFWDGGRPTKPKAGHFDQGTPVDELAIHVGTMLRLGDSGASDFVALASLVADELERVKNDITVLKGATQTGLAGVPGTSGALGTAFEGATALVPSEPGDVAAEKVQAY